MNTHTLNALFMFASRFADDPNLQPGAGADAGLAVGLPDWWQRHPEEESSAPIGQHRSHQSRWAEVFVDETNYMRVV